MGQGSAAWASLVAWAFSPNPIYVNIACTMISDSLLAAFLNAHYVVFTPDASFLLRIGQYSADLSRLMSECGLNTAAVLTAFNPGAVPADAKTNRDAQQQLLTSIQKLHVPYFLGQNFAPDGNGPAEPTVVVIGMPRQQAHALAQQFGQLAFVFSDSSAIPELSWTYPTTYLSDPAPGQ